MIGQRRVRLTRRGREPEPASFEDALLAVLGVTGVIPADGAGMWVYGLRDAAGETFYVGQSESVLTRLGAHRTAFGALLCSVWLVPVTSPWAMTTTEDFLIDRLQPRMNIRGMADEEAQLRARAARTSAASRAVHAGMQQAGRRSGRPPVRGSGQEAAS